MLTFKPTGKAKKPLRSPEGTCAFVFVDNNRKETPCPHQRFDEDGFCVFHSRKLEKKKQTFPAALETWIKQSESKPEIKLLDFRGFVFPAVSFQRNAFSKEVDFRQAQFLESVDFRATRFGGSANFYSASFSQKAFFQGALFTGFVQFVGCTFQDKAVFGGVRFSKDAVFHGCKFRDLFALPNAVFCRMAILQSNTCYKDADFKNCQFNGGVDFEKTIFARRASFQGAKFQNTITFADSQIGILKGFNASGVNFDGAILESVNFEDAPRLVGFSFRNAFLLALNFNEREFVNCDFTGAVFKGTLTQGWKPDKKTLANTKYIFTDYESCEDIDEHGTRKAYRAIPGTRVPVDGAFGTAEHSDFTLAEYLKEPFRWNLAFKVPPGLRTPFLNYVQLFADFMKVTEDLSVEIRTRHEGEKLRVEFLTESEEAHERVQEKFDDYKANAGKDFSALKIRFSPRAPDSAKRLFEMRMNNWVNNLWEEFCAEKLPAGKGERRAALPDVLEEKKLFAPIPMDTQTSQAIRLVFSYSHKDEKLRDELETHLTLLKRQGFISTWHDRRILGGENWKGVIDENFRRADLILLLISADFIASDYCYETEMNLSLERDSKGEARVVPIILRTCVWQSAPFGKLQGLPKDGKPVTSWPDRDEAWTDVAEGMKRIVEALRSK